MKGILLIILIFLLFLAFSSLGCLLVGVRSEKNIEKVVNTLDKVK